MTALRVSSVLGVCLAAGILWTAEAADPIGDVEVVTVSAFGTPPETDWRILRPRTGVFANELIENVPQGEVLIRFADGTTLGIGSDSTIVLDELVYGGGADDSMVLSASEGFLHFVTGDIAPEAVVIETPAMIISIRGTDVVVAVSETALGVRDGRRTDQDGRKGRNGRSQPLVSAASAFPRASPTPLRARCRDPVVRGAEASQPAGSMAPAAAGRAMARTTPAAETTTPECPETARELRLYSYEVDRHTGDVKPRIRDACNHYIDATRYACSPMIRRRGLAGVFVKKQYRNPKETAT